MFKVKSLKAKHRTLHLAVLCSGGDAPGMNAAIRAVVRTGIARGCELSGIMRGYSGLLEGEIFTLKASSVANIIHRGGTILKTDRCPAFFKREVRAEAAHILTRKGIDALVVIGGDGSFEGARKLESETGFRCIGVPGTIDNDIGGTDDTIGFDTAVNTAIQSIDRIRDTASSHDRTFIVEVMGRHSGFIALNTGIGGGAESILMPEFNKSARQNPKQVCELIERGMRRGKSSSIIIVAEGNVRDSKHGGQAETLAHELAKAGHRAKVCILGHTQRGGSPTAHDRLLASVLGAYSVEALLADKSGVMVGVRNADVVLVPLAQIAKLKTKPSPKLYEMAKLLSS